MTIRTRAGRDLLGWRGNHATWTERRWVEAIEAIELEAMRQHELLGPTIVVWLIERGQSEGYASPIYYADRETQMKPLRHDPAWTRDAYRAMRFPTKEAALTFMESQRDGDRPMPGRPVEHGFIDTPSPDTGVADGAGLDAIAGEGAFREMAQRGWFNLPDGHGPRTAYKVFEEAYARLAAVPEGEQP